MGGDHPKEFFMDFVCDEDKMLNSVETTHMRITIRPPIPIKKGKRYQVMVDEGRIMLAELLLDREFDEGDIRFVRHGMGILQ